MSIKIFITGTDTDVGKTYITSGLLNAFNQHKFSTLGIKPLASGCSKKNGGTLQNDDALQLQAASSIKLHYHQINPFAFEPPIAPHIAAMDTNRLLTARELMQKTQYALQYPADVCLVEGAGGWLVPLNDQETMADFVKAAGLKTLLVVGLRLGCINHTLLTYEAIKQAKVPLIGWIANRIDSQMLLAQKTIDTLKEWLPIPYLGQVSYKQTVMDAIDVNYIIKNLMQ